MYLSILAVLPLLVPGRFWRLADPSNVQQRHLPNWSLDFQLTTFSFCYMAVLNSTRNYYRKQDLCKYHTMFSLCLLVCIKGTVFIKLFYFINCKNKNKNTWTAQLYQFYRNEIKIPAMLSNLEPKSAQQTKVKVRNTHSFNMPASLELPPSPLHLGSVYHRMSSLWKSRLHLFKELKCCLQIFHMCPCVQEEHLSGRTWTHGHK